MPTKTDVVDFIKRSPNRTGKRDIARAFGVKGADRVALKAMIKELEAEGAFELSTNKTFLEMHENHSRFR